MVDALIIANIVALVVNSILLLVVLFELFNLKKQVGIKFKALVDIEKQIEKINEAVKTVMKSQIERLKLQEKPKVIPFTPQDLEKFKEELDAS
jgi:ABC-type phosphate transport system auxiliary subunit